MYPRELYLKLIHRGWLLPFFISSTADCKVIFFLLVISMMKDFMGTILKWTSCFISEKIHLKHLNRTWPRGMHNASFLTTRRVCELSPIEGSGCAFWSVTKEKTPLFFFLFPGKVSSFKSCFKSKGSPITAIQLRSVWYDSIFKSTPLDSIITCPVLG